MARARNIKPSFFQNDALGELPPLARLLFIGMWTIADFKGCMEYRPKRIKAQLLPYDECDIEALVAALDKSRFVTIYSLQGQRYIKITNFEKHQNPHPNEKKAGSEIPDIDEKGCVINELEEIVINHEQNGTDRADSLIPHPDSLIPQQTTCAAAPAIVIEQRQDVLDAIERELDKQIPAEKPAAKPEPEQAYTLPLNTGDEFPITPQRVAEFGMLYPAVDVMAELRKMRGWLTTNPTKRKTKTGILKFVNSWLSRQQDEAGARKQPTPQRTGGRPSINASFTPGADDDIFNQMRRELP